MINLDNRPNLDSKCLISINNDSWIWHKRLAHVSIDLIDKLSKNDLIVGLYKLKFFKDKICDTFQKGKQVKTYFKYKNIVSTPRPLQFLHIDLIVPSRIKSHDKNYYTFMIVDNFSRFTWTLFLTHKNDTFHIF